jgi:hypothetical protein
MTLEELQKKRGDDWRTLLKKQGKLQKLDAKVFDGDETSVDAFMCSQNELEWAQYLEEKQVLVRPIADLLDVAIQQQGLPAKLSIAYRGRFVVVQKDDTVSVSALYIHPRGTIGPFKRPPFGAL